jgi:phosphopantothenoylcysteine decarboxylase/phosphopantothenate--cysteine ligase
MYNHPIVKENIEKLKRIGIAFIDPVTLEGKAKIADTDSIVRFVESFLIAGKPLAGKSILVSAGPTIEFIDPVRIITNRSSGKMGIALCDQALLLGAKVTLVYGPGTEAPPRGVRVVNVLTADQMHDAVIRELKDGSYDIIIAASAVSDFSIKNPSATKIPTSSTGELTLELIPTPKIIDAVKETDPNVFLVAFRAVTRLSDTEIVEDAYGRLGKAKADLIVANDVSRKGAGFFTDTNEVFVIDDAKNVTHLPLGPKRKIAAGILEIVRQKMEKR